ncbi:hypothetical protein BT63DRAFT_454215 [Microthyrium microscopicum]|uniref:Zn(2)-C6 fungal-type domain-containing protein n=1 Tax=Microthyrium microscopicum TaxID=703497 RepID=A0A6A6UDY6_9PEZI|nr:hypothetical protein BT63DRAFT_454215 [Microthyrium microscopicum]
MVFCGKPSDACEGCRTRRIKCDRKIPSCTQCINKSIECTGYRNQLDLSFRNETKKVVQKFEKTQRKLNQKTAKSRSPELIKQSRQSTMIWVPPSLDQPVQDAAVCHFLTAYAPGSHFDYLAEIYTKVPATTPFLASTSAAAMANLSRERKEPEILKRARTFYAQALEQTTSALQSNDATLDSTLISVLILSLFETVAQDSCISSDGWNTHIFGALALLKMRGPRQFETALGRKLYIHVSNNIRVTCAQRAKPLPLDFIELDIMAMPYMDYSSPILRTWPIVDDFIELQIMLRDKEASDPAERLRIAMKVEDACFELSNTLQPPWTYEIVDAEETPNEAFRFFAHRYSSHLIARLWNSIRMIRLFVNEVIVEGTAVKPDASQAERNAWLLIRSVAAQTAQNMAMDILASVPQFIRTPLQDPSKRLSATIAGGFIWPISAVGGSKLVSIDTRWYATESLHIIGREARLPQATTIAEMLETGQDPMQWLHMFHLA